MMQLDRKSSHINSEISTYSGLGNFYSSVQGKVLTFQEKANYLAQSGWMVSDIKDEIEDPFRQRISSVTDEICSVDATQFTTENTIGLKGYVTTTVNDGITSRTSESTIVLDSLNLTDFLGADRESVTTVSHSGGGATYTTTTTTLRDSDPHFSGLFRESYDKYIEQARWNNGMISHMPDGAPELHYMETMSYEEYLSALVPKDREYDRYAGAWNEMLAESFDAFLGLGLIYKAVTGEEAFTGDKLTQNEREEAAASGAFALTVSVLTSAIGGTGWSGFATMLLADAAGGVVGVVTYEGLTNMGLSDSEAFLLSFFAGVVTGNGIERMAYSSPTYIDDLAKRMGKSPDEMAYMLGNLSDVAAKYNYSSVDDMLNNLSPAARDDIMKMFDKPLGSFDLKTESRFFKNSQTDKVVGGGIETIELSKSNIQHVKKHTFDGMVEQAKYLSDEQLANKLSNTSFFNKNWSQEEIIKYTQEAYSTLKHQGKTGLQSIDINGETINVFIKDDGTFDTAYGAYKYTIDDFR